ncbi:hypothetical protein DWUX_1584 [Desulfovibrio diazotrophicus]|nr:hypothetical protein DWUX_1584 [Desulfovibrio diazotrophicus]
MAYSCLWARRRDVAAATFSRIRGFFHKLFFIKINNFISIG